MKDHGKIPALFRRPGGALLYSFRTAVKPPQYARRLLFPAIRHDHGTKDRAKPSVEPILNGQSEIAAAKAAVAECAVVHGDLVQAPAPGSGEKACPAVPVKYKRTEIQSHEIRVNHPRISSLVSRWVCLARCCAGISMGIVGGGDGEVHRCGRGEVGQLSL